MTDQSGYTSGYSGGGNYSVTSPTSSDGSWFAGAGTYTESGTDTQALSTTVEYNLGSAGAWQATSGAGTGTDTAVTSWGYSSGGGYGYPQPTFSVTGTWQAASGDTTTYASAVTFTLGSDGTWGSTGTATVTDANGSTSGYAGGGSYTLSSLPSSDGSWLTGSGTETESGSDTQAVSSTALYALDSSGNWQPVNGTGTGTETAVFSWGYSSGGGYGYPLATGSVSGTWQAAGGDTTTYAAAVTFTLGSDGTWGNSGTGSISDVNGYTSGYSGGGSYTVGSAPSSDGSWLTGSGTETESGSDTQVVSSTVLYNLDSGGNWQALSGTGLGTDTAVTSWGYNASGTYGYPLATGSVSGTWQASGGDTTASGTAVTFTLGSDGTWGSSGTGTVTDLYGYTSGYSGGGSYTVSSPTSSDGSWLTGSGTETESGNDTQAVSSTALYTLDSSGNWQPVSGTSTGTETAVNSWGYTSGGTYGYPLATGSVSGTWQAGGGTTTYGSLVTFTLGSDGTWASTGAATVTDLYRYQSAYGGGGSYTISSTGNADGSWLTGSGTETESGNDTLLVSSTVLYSLDSGGKWQALGGTGTGTETATTRWGYTAGGAYGYPQPTFSVSGTWQVSGGDTTNYATAVAFTLGSDGTWGSTGTGTVTDLYGYTSSYSGGGSYTVGNSGGPDGSWLTGSGTYTESGSDTQAVSSAVLYTLDSGGKWQALSGTGTGTETAVIGWGYTAGGTYGYPLPTGSVSGTWQASGGDKTTYNTAVTFTLGSDGTWGSTGTGTVSDINGFTVGYAGCGSYTISSPPSSDGSWLTGSGAETESGSDTQVVSSTVSYTLDSGGNWQTLGGTGTGTEIAVASWSYTAGGAYGYPLANGSVSGTWQASGSDTTTYGSAVTFTLGSDGTWARSGTAGVTRTDAYLVSYSGGGSYTVGSDDGAGTWVSGSGTESESGGAGWAATATVGYTLDGSGQWQLAGGTASSLGAGWASWSASASGSYGRPMDYGSLTGTWQAAAGATSSYGVVTNSTLGSDGTWQTTGAAVSSGLGTWGASYAGSGSSSWSAGSDDGSFSATKDSSATESGSSVSSYQYAALSVLAADGSVTTTTVVAAAGTSGAANTYTADGTSDTCSDNGDYSDFAWSQALSESTQSYAQEGYTITTGPGGTTVTGGAWGGTLAGGSAVYVSAGTSETVSSNDLGTTTIDTAWGRTSADAFAYAAAWSVSSDGQGVPTASASASNHAWGGWTDWSSVDWTTAAWWGSVSGSWSTSVSEPYDVTATDPGFSSQAFAAGGNPGYGGPAGWSLSGGPVVYGAAAFAGVAFAFSGSAGGSAGTGPAGQPGRAGTPADAGTGPAAGPGLWADGGQDSPFLYSGGMPLANSGACIQGCHQPPKWNSAAPGLFDQEGFGYEFLNGACEPLRMVGDVMRATQQAGSILTNKASWTDIYDYEPHSWLFGGAKQAYQQGPDAGARYTGEAMFQTGTLGIPALWEALKNRDSVSLSRQLGMYFGGAIFAQALGGSGRTAPSGRAAQTAQLQAFLRGEQGPATPPRLLDSIIADANRVASRDGAITESQATALRQNLPVVQRRGVAANQQLRTEFEARQADLIADWEAQTGRTWPTGATPHHIIPLESGGANAWWNLMPTNASLPNHSLPGIPGPHAAGGVLRQTIQQPRSVLPPGQPTDLRQIWP